MKSVAENKVFVGIDVHRKSYSVCCVIDGTLVKRCRMAANARLLIGFLMKNFPGQELHAAYEAGFSGFELHRALEEAGIQSRVVHAASIEVSQSRVKTDKRDAAKIAIQLAAGRLQGIRIPTREEEQRRQLTRTRQQLIKHRTAIKNQIRSKLHVFDLMNSADEREMSIGMVEEVLNKTTVEELRVSIEALKEVWLALNEQLRVLQAEIRRQAKGDALEKIYRSLPGFGPLASRICSNELGDCSQFSSCKKLYGYTGLTPGEHSSGEKVHRSGITRQGNARLRQILIQSAWVAVRKDAGLAADFERIASHGSKLRAIVAIARKLIGRARALLRDSVLYQVKLAA